MSSIIRKGIAAAAVCILALPLSAAQIFVATTGSDSNSGTEISPFATITAAVENIAAGDTVYVRGGTYALSGDRINLTQNGEPGKLCKIWAYPGETPILDGTGLSSGNNIMHLRGNYWHVKGLIFENSPDNGMRVGGNNDVSGGSNNIIENCVFRYNGDSGLQMGRSSTGAANDGTYAANNLVLNCDAIRNCDGSGSNADGFACKLAPGAGNVFKGCRSYENSDDGFDFWASQYPITVENCWVWHNGDPAVCASGNGNGIKVGGSDNHAKHIIKNCVVFDHHYTSGNNKGIDQNHDLSGVTIYNCLSFNNEYNYSLWEKPDDGSQHVLKNNVSINPIIAHHWNDSASDTVNNSWNMAGITADESDYVSLSEDDAKASRQADGSLPDNGFAKLKAGSDLVDAGVDVGLIYAGTAPDLGPYELDATPVCFARAETGLKSVSLVSIEGTMLQLILLKNCTRLRIALYDLCGQQLLSETLNNHAGTGLQRIAAGSLQSGMYLCKVTLDGRETAFRVAKK